MRTRLHCLSKTGRGGHLGSHGQSSQDSNAPERGQKQCGGVDFSLSRTDGDVYNSDLQCGGLMDQKGPDKGRESWIPEASLNALQQLLWLHQLRAGSAHISPAIRFPFLHPEPTGKGRCQAAGMGHAWSLEVKVHLSETQIHVGCLSDQCWPVMVRGEKERPLSSSFLSRTPLCDSVCPTGAHFSIHSRNNHWTTFQDRACARVVGL